MFDLFNFYEKNLIGPIYRNFPRVQMLPSVVPRAYGLPPEAATRPLETHVGPYAAAHRTATVHRIVEMDDGDLLPPASSCASSHIK